MRVVCSTTPPCFVTSARILSSLSSSVCSSTGCDRIIKPSYFFKRFSLSLRVELVHGGLRAVRYQVLHCIGGRDDQRVHAVPQVGRKGRQHVRNQILVFPSAYAHPESYKWILSQMSENGKQSLVPATASANPNS